MFLLCVITSRSGEPVRLEDGNTLAHHSITNVVTSPKRDESEMNPTTHFPDSFFAILHIALASKFLYCSTKLSLERYRCHSV